jgi:3-oxoacyl-[acyl-carrier protein] reductase
MGLLKGKTALITGASRGIGKAIAHRFALEGADIAMTNIVDDEEFRTTIKELQELGIKAKGYVSNAAKFDDSQRVINEVVADFSRIDILVNNAAFYMRQSLTIAPFNQLDIKEWDRVMEVNLKGPFLCARAVFPYMQAQKAGKIINITSDTFFMGRKHMAHYVASKGGVIGLTRVLANELGEYNINVNCIAPGSTFSEDSHDLEGLERRKQILPLRALKRVEYPEDLVGTVVFLASSESDFITGQTIAVNGGMSMT